jgi:hypothetical protein
MDHKFKKEKKNFLREEKGHKGAPLVSAGRGDLLKMPKKAPLVGTAVSIPDSATHVAC